MQSLASALGSIGGLVFSWSLTGFLVLNALALAVVAVKRNRHLVNTWTPRYLAANLVLIGVGLGVPLMTQAMKLVVTSVQVLTSTDVSVVAK